MGDSFNPFANPNPFKEETIYKETKPTVQTNVIDDYEPFDNRPAVLPTETTETTHTKLSVGELEKLQRELEDRSRKLAEQEERLNQSQHITQNNFPPLPKCFPIKPCFYQEIDVEIPEEYRKIVRVGFITWIAYSLTLLINIIGTLCNVIIREGTMDSGPTFGLSIVYCILFIPLSYLCWFRPLYNAFKNNSSFNYFLFFLIFGCQIIVLIVQVLGINVLGSCGWIISISMGSKNVGVMVFMIIIAIIFTIDLGLCIFIFLRVNIYFRTSGGSIQKAKEEFSNRAVSNQTVRSTTSDIIRNY